MEQGLASVTYVTPARILTPVKRWRPSLFLPEWRIFSYKSSPSYPESFSLLLQGSVAAYAARAIWNMASKHSGNQDAAREAGAIPALVHMLYSPTPQVLAPCSNADMMFAMKWL